VEENRPTRKIGTENTEIVQGDDYQDDYQYDEAHDAPVGSLGGAIPAPHRVDPPTGVNFGPGGDYGYDEAHDFGTS
jgi:hypothetical protein